MTDPGTPVSPARSQQPSNRQRGRTACTRCKARKQRCDGQLPTCWNCARARAHCDLSNIRSEDSGLNKYVNALENRVAELELKLAAGQKTPEEAPAVPPATAPESRLHLSLDEILEFLAIGSFGLSPVRPASGMGLALHLEDIVQASVWNKAIVSSESHFGWLDPSTGEPRIGGHGFNLEAIRAKSARPPSDEDGARLIRGYFRHLDATYPFLDIEQILALHRDKEALSATRPMDLEPDKRFGLFKLNLIYAIGSGLLDQTATNKMPPGPDPAEAFYLAALQHIAAARESRSLENIEAMTLLVIFHLRRAINHGVWYMIGLAMRTCIDLGLNSSQGEVGLEPPVVQRRRKLFWTVYTLERNISISLGYPISLSDRQIDVGFPWITAESDDNLRQAVSLFGLRVIESRINVSIYRKDRPLESLIGKMERYFKELRGWKDALMGSVHTGQSHGDLDYLLLQYYRAIRLLVQPFLRLLSSTDPYFQACLDAVGQVCQIHNRRYRRVGIRHSFFAVQTVFVSGIIMLYCLWTKSIDVWSVNLSNDIRSCTSILYVMGERAPWVRRYRDAYEVLVNMTMERLQHKGSGSSSGSGPTAAGPPERTEQPSSFQPAAPSELATARHVDRNDRTTAAHWGPQPALGPSFRELLHTGCECVGQVDGGTEAGSDTFLPPLLQVIEDRWLDFYGIAQVEELANLVNQENETSTPPWMRGDRSVP